MTAFTENEYELDRCNLRRLSSAEAKTISESLVEIDPWRTLKTKSTRFANHFSKNSEEGGTWGIFLESKLIGVVSIKPDWLMGPYLELLGLLPDGQGLKLGTAVLNWMETEARRFNSRNLFLCVSDFNLNAIEFYKKQGFSEVALLEGLIVDNHGEYLMRKQLF